MHEAPAWASPTGGGRLDVHSLTPTLFVERLFSRLETITQGQNGATITLHQPSV